MEQNIFKNGKRIILVVLGLLIYNMSNKYFITHVSFPQNKIFTFEGTTFNDAVLANGFKPKQNRFKGKLIVALNKKFIKNNNMMNKTYKVTIEYYTKKGKILKQDSIVVMDKINSRFKNSRIDFFNNKANPNYDNIGKVYLTIKQ